MKINKYYLLLFLYIFSFGYSLSYKPPHMLSAPIYGEIIPMIQKWPEPERVTFVNNTICIWEEPTARCLK